MDYHVYILATPQRDALHTGVTNNIAHCKTEHQNDNGQLVYFETYDRLDHAVRRESQIKHSERDRTIELVEALNPEWDDLYPTLNR